jgi:hypothetical protein
MSASDIEMEDINVTPRWSVAFEQGNAVVNVSPQHVQDLANGWFALFSFEREKNICANGARIWPGEPRASFHSHVVGDDP